MKNYIESLNENQWKLSMEDVIGDPMYQLFGVNSSVTNIEIPSYNFYEKGDIIVFRSGGKNIIHRIEYVYSREGEIYYFTKGVTYTFVDDALVTVD